MKTTALRLYGKRDLRLETFDLPEMQEDEILATVVTDSLCLSSWKEANLGENHKKVPDDVATNPIIIGHEFCGDILAVGKKWQHKFQPGQRYVIQANLQLPDRPDCPGYSFPSGRRRSDACGYSQRGHGTRLPAGIRRRNLF